MHKYHKAVYHVTIYSYNHSVENHFRFQSLPKAEGGLLKFMKIPLSSSRTAVLGKEGTSKLAFNIQSGLMSSLLDATFNCPGFAQMNPLK